VAVVEVCRSGADKKVMDRTSMANESAAVHTERTALGVGPLEVGLYPRDGAIPVLADHASLLSRRGGLVVCRGRSGSGGGGGDRGAQPEEACAVAGRPSRSAREGASARHGQRVCVPLLWFRQHCCRCCSCSKRYSKKEARRGNFTWDLVQARFWSGWRYATYRGIIELLLAHSFPPGNTCFRQSKRIFTGLTYGYPLKINV